MYQVIRTEGVVLMDDEEFRAALDSGEGTISLSAKALSEGGMISIISITDRNIDTMLNRELVDIDNQ